MRVLVVSLTTAPVESVVVVVTVWLPSLSLLVSTFSPVTALPSTVTFVLAPGIGVGLTLGVAVRVPNNGVGVVPAFAGVAVATGVVVPLAVGVAVGELPLKTPNVALWSESIILAFELALASTEVFARVTLLAEPEITLNVTLATR